jgi:Ser/Thr protein kinase RdoA (MazF antagonist)
LYLIIKTEDLKSYFVKIDYENPGIEQNQQKIFEFLELINNKNLAKLPLRKNQSKFFTNYNKKYTISIYKKTVFGKPQLSLQNFKLIGRHLSEFHKLKPNIKVENQADIYPFLPNNYSSLSKYNLPICFTHGDLKLENLHFNAKGEFASFIDFGLSNYGFTILDLLIFVYICFCENNNFDYELLDSFFIEYHKYYPINIVEIDVLIECMELVIQSSLSWWLNEYKGNDEIYRQKMISNRVVGKKYSLAYTKYLANDLLK